MPAIGLAVFDGSVGNWGALRARAEVSGDFVLALLRHQSQWGILIPLWQPIRLERTRTANSLCNVDNRIASALS